MAQVRVVWTVDELDFLLAGDLEYYVVVTLAAEMDLMTVEELGERLENSTVA